MRAGPKGQADLSPLPFRPRSTGADRFAAFCRKFIVTPKGRGAKAAFRVRDWQRDLVATVHDERSRIVLWVLPRGCGKSTLTAAIALHHVFDSGIEGARCVVVAQDERSALRLLATATRMVSLNEDLESRCRVYKDRIVVPRTDSQIVALPAEAARIEGEDASLAVLDEVGFCRRDSYESLLHSTGKRDGSKLLAIGTPSPPSWRGASPMFDLVMEARSGESEDLRLVEFGGDPTHPVDCSHCWDAVPGIDDLVSRDHLRAALPPRSREIEFRRARLAEWVEHDDASFLPQGVWDGLSTGEGVPDGQRVVVSLDGSFSDDSTALLVATVDPHPHVDVVGLWQPDKDAGERVPITEVEDAVRAACRRWEVVEVVADPFRWARTLQVLEGDGLPVVEFPHSPSRLTAATTDLYRACVNGELSHSGDKRLASHVAAAVVREHNGGIRLDKTSRQARARKIDLAAALVMAHSRATWRAMKKSRKKTRSFAA